MPGLAVGDGVAAGCGAKLLLISSQVSGVEFHIPIRTFQSSPSRTEIAATSSNKARTLSETHVEHDLLSRLSLLSASQLWATQFVADKAEGIR